MSGLRFSVGDLIGRPGAHRDVSGELALELKVGETTVDDSAVVTARLEAISDGILVRAQASALTTHQCARCLLEWSDPLEVEIVELFVRRSSADKLATEDVSVIAGDLTIDLEGVVHDEISLNLEAVPLCKPDCRGLCPICGADLNMAPCGGHGDDLASPFAALRQLFEAET